MKIAKNKWNIKPKGLFVSVYLAGIRLGWTRPTIQTIDFCNNIHLHMRYTAQHLKQHKLPKYTPSIYTPYTPYYPF